MIMFDDELLLQTLVVRTRAEALKFKPCALSWLQVIAFKKLALPMYP